MGGPGSGRKPEGHGLVLRSDAPVAGAAPKLTGEALAVSRLVGPMMREMGGALAGGDPDAAVAAVVARGRGRRSPVWRKAAIVALSASAMPQKEIAEIVGMTHRSLRTTLYLMRKAGVLADTTDRLDHGIVPDAIEALHADVLNPESPGHQKAYLAALSGRGALRTYTEGKNEGGVVQMTALTVQFEMPEGPRPVMNGQVVGAPRTGDVKP